jgi:hypothetical protein
MSPDPKNREREPHDAKDAPRRPYTAPRLKVLGSVRDLTLGSPGKFVDAVTGTMAMAM